MVRVSVKTVCTTDLVTVSPPHSLPLSDPSHGLGEAVRHRHDEVAVQDRDDVTLGVEGAGHLLVYPVLLLGVPQAPVERSGGADQQEVTR